MSCSARADGLRAVQRHFPTANLTATVVTRLKNVVIVIQVVVVVLVLTVTVMVAQLLSQPGRSALGLVLSSGVCVALSQPLLLMAAPPQLLLLHL